MHHSQAILRQQFDTWQTSQQTKIFLEFLVDRREKLVNEIKFSAQRDEKSEGTARRAMRLVELDEIIAHIQNVDKVTEYGSRGIIDTASG
tara:strand:- start:806 stop:1075 length:270 start_codon:yes stop_codon:yes gene_type:complete